MSSETALGQNAVRYAAASSLALALDFLLTMGLRIFTPLSLTSSAAIGFIVIGILFYFVHEFWTFKREDAAFSGRRLAKNFMVLCCAFAARIGTIATLEWIYPSGIFLGVIYFGIGVAISFSINFLVNRYWVFANTA